MRLLRRVAGCQFLFLALLLAPTLWARLHAKWSPPWAPVWEGFVRTGAVGALCATLFLALTGTLACLLLASARHRTFRHEGLDTSLERAPVTIAAGWPQAIVVLAGAALAASSLHVWPPLPALARDTMPNWPVSAALMVIPAFFLMVLESVVSSTSPGRLPEVPSLAALLRLPVVALAAHAAIIVAGGFGLPGGTLAATVVDVFFYIVAAELAVRTVAVWFLPPPVPELARASIGSAAASLLQPGALRPGEMTRRMRRNFGIDISRSWAVAYARTAAAPVLLVLLMFTWGLSGVTRINLDQRGSYERFGAPVAMLRPGLHVLLPWPFGRVRLVEYGVVHALPIGATVNGPTNSGQLPQDASTADGPAPRSANRLWDEQLRNDTSYIIASQTGDRQSFETVSVVMTVLYRIGLDDESARRALYGAIDQAALVRALAGRELSHFFASRTLLAVLGERNEEIATQLRGALQADLDRDRSGLEVVALVVESMHPPSGAATAYRGVQTEQIIASMRYSEEMGRAQGTLSVAAADAHNMRDSAAAAAAELVSSATVERWQSSADTLAFRHSGNAFLIERYFANLGSALSKAAVEIMDSRLGAATTPILDLRPTTTNGTAPVAPAASQDNSQ
ncbi:SPFH domain-containing protein [Acidisoma sp.]|uniref:SPFH domain-containing protein n=1 Tax=Acidisoma sp. TaxID=1872115 RepID=UPI003AFF8136